VQNLLKRRGAIYQATGRQEEQQGDGQRKAWVPGPPVVHQPRAVHNAAALAYMGDAIFELYVRRHFLTPPQSMDNYNRQVTALVCCEAQHALLLKLLKDNVLTEEEKDVLRWGKNQDSGNRGARRRAGGLVYNSASSLETLIGYLYLKNVERLEEIMELMGFTAEARSLQHV
jgi:ribonuclease-3 family protein